MCGVSDNTEKTDTFVTDTDITETPIGSVSPIIDTLDAVADIKNDICNGAEGIDGQWYWTYWCFSDASGSVTNISVISDTEHIGVSVMWV